MRQACARCEIGESNRLSLIVYEYYAVKGWGVIGLTPRGPHGDCLIKGGSQLNGLGRKFTEVGVVADGPFCG